MFRQIVDMGMDLVMRLEREVLSVDGGNCRMGFVEGEE